MTERAAQTRGPFSLIKKRPSDERELTALSLS